MLCAYMHVVSAHVNLQPVSHHGNHRVLACIVYVTMHVHCSGFYTLITPVKIFFASFSQCLRDPQSYVRHTLGLVELEFHA
jgi:hypothetical protein